MPRHRAQRPAVHSDRRVPVTAAIVTAGPALEDARPWEADDADATVPIPAPRLRVPRTRLARSERLAATEPGLMAGAVRGLAVTPWFAAATGFVVAAGLWIYSPHAELKFPPSAVGVVPCEAQGCGITAGQDGGALATTKGRPITPAGKSAGKAAAQTDGEGGAAASRFTFSYVVLWQAGGRFGVRISVTGKHVPRTWKLTFAMPGDDINDVLGADWRPSGAGGGTASGPAARRLGCGRPPGKEAMSTRAVQAARTPPALHQLSGDRPGHAGGADQLFLQRAQLLVLLARRGLLRQRRSLP